MSVLALARPEIRAMKPYGSARGEQARLDVLLNANENPFDPSGAGLNRYPDPQPAELLEAMADYFRVTADRILATRGSDEAIDLVVRAFCRAGVDSVAWCPPTFGMYRVAAETQGAGRLTCALRAEQGYDLDLAAIDGALARGARVLFLCSPNNPTGNAMPRGQVEAVLGQARGRALVVVDEAYGEFGGESVVELLGAHDHLAVLRTFSKAWALAGARCGVLLGDSAVIDLLRRIMPPYPLPSPTVGAVHAALQADRLVTMRAQVARLSAERDRLAARLAAHPAVLEVFPSDANFLLVRVRDADALLARATAAGIALRDMRSQPTLDGCVRISIGSPRELERLDALLADFAPSAGSGRG